MPTIAIVNEKGGTGKTSTAVNLSAALGMLGRKVLLVDLDGQAASSRWLGVEEDTSFADALWRGEGLCPVPDVIPGVSLAPGSGKLDSVAHDLRPTQGGQLRKLLLQQSGFDYILIDCPPSLGNRLIGNALLAATHAIVPVETSILALDGLKILLTTMEDVRDGFGHDIVLMGVLACRFDGRTRLSRFILDELNRALPGRVFKTIIRENVRMRECPASGQSILTFAPNCHAAEDYMSLAREILAAREGDGARKDTADRPRKDELSGEERMAISDLRGQVDTMLRGIGSSPPVRDTSAANTEGKTDDKGGRQPAEYAHAGLADPENDNESDRSADVPETPEPAPAQTIQDARLDEPADAWTQAQTDSTVPAEQEAQVQEDDWQIGQPRKRGHAVVEGSREASPNDPAEEQAPARPLVLRSETPLRRAVPAGMAEQVADEQPEQSQPDLAATQKDEAQAGEPEDDEAQVGESEDSEDNGQDDYPALRAMVQQIGD